MCGEERESTSGVNITVCVCVERGGKARPVGISQCVCGEGRETTSGVLVC